QGQGEEGIAQVRQGIATWRETGAAVHVPYFCTLLAEVSARLGHTGHGLQALTEAHTLVEQHEEPWWEAEIYRLRGGASCSCGKRGRSRRRRKLGCSGLCTSPAASRRSRWSYALPRAWCACGSARASAPKPTSCWRRSTTGSPRALTRLIFKRP